MTPAQSTLIHFARETLGDKGTITDADAIAPWLTDWRGRWHGQAPAILAPDSTAGVAAIVAKAAELGVPLVPQGGNTSMVGGATPPEDGSAVLLSLRRMNKVRRLEAGEGLAVMEAGVILHDLHEAALATGQRFPLSLGAKGSATVGGLVSTNAGGTQVLRFGTMRGLVAGLEAVLPNGDVHDGLAALKKDNRGYDLTQLLVGAEGTLGVVTAATLRLVPAAAQRAVAWVALASPDDALALLRQMEAATHSIESFELVPQDALDSVLAHIDGTRPPLEGRHAWHALIEATAPGVDDEAPAALLERLIGDALEGGLVSDAVIAASEAQAEGFWRIRESISEAERARGPLVALDISVPIAGMPAFLKDAVPQVEAAYPGSHALAYGHLGDGNVHFHVRAPDGADRATWMAQDAIEATHFVDDLVVAAGGSISAEHGIGQMKLSELERLSSPARLSALRAIKRAMDPAGLFNPGKLVTLAPERAAP